MKILYNTYPMAFGTPGGGEIQLLQYKKYSNYSEIDISLFDLWKPEFSNFDFLHFFSCIPGSIYFIQYAKSRGLPVIISPNLWIKPETKKLYPSQEIEAQLIQADRIVCNSEMECDMLSLTFNLPRFKFYKVYNGVEDAFFDVVDANLFREKSKIKGNYLLNVANIEPRKNQLRLMKAIKKFPDLKLIIIGNVRDEEYFKRCKDIGGSQLFYAGPLPHDSELLRSAYAGCSLFVLPSTLETPGLAALEAAAAGARILITSEGCTKEYFGNEVTYIDPMSVLSISNGIKLALNRPQGNLKEYVREKFNWKEVIKRLVDLYKNKEVFLEQVNGKGFNLTEKDDEGWFVWSKRSAQLKCEIGTIAFTWRAIQPSIVEVLVDGIPLSKGVVVSTGWSPFAISVHRNDMPVELRVTPINESAGVSDERTLGVALRHIKYLGANVSPIEKSKWLTDQGLIFDAQRIEAQGFYSTEKDDEGWFVWSSYEANISFDKGLVRWKWNVTQESNVRLLLNGFLLKPLTLNPGWTLFELDLRSYTGRQQITFQVTPNTQINHSDTRSLGVALRDINIQH